MQVTNVDERTRSERLLIELTHRILLRPESEIIFWDSRVVITVIGWRKLDLVQNKTSTPHKIGFSQAMEEYYTHTGVNSMLHRSIQKADKLHAAKGIGAMDYVRYRDLKDKGATGQSSNQADLATACTRELDHHRDLHQGTLARN